MLEVFKTTQFDGFPESPRGGPRGAAHHVRPGRRKLTLFRGPARHHGLLVLVLEEGFLLEGAVDFEATGIIESWLPLLLFSLLFGRSIDLRDVRDGPHQGASRARAQQRRAIAEGVKGTAVVITNAAAIMVAVALIFAFMRGLDLKQFGFGPAMATLFDATVIRAFVLPAAMQFRGEWNWYLPSWLEWLPHLPMAEEVEPLPLGAPVPTPSPAPTGGSG